MTRTTKQSIIDTLQTRLTLAETEIERLKLIIKDQNVAISASKDNNRLLNDRNAALERDIREKNQAIATMLQNPQLREIEQRVESINDQLVSQQFNDHAADQIRALEQDLADAHRTIRDRQQEHIELNKQLAERNQRIADLVSSTDDLREMNERESKRAQAWQERADQLANKVERLEYEAVLIRAAAFDAMLHLIQISPEGE